MKCISPGNEHQLAWNGNIFWRGLWASVYANEQKQKLTFNMPIVREKNSNKGEREQQCIRNMQWMWMSMTASTLPYFIGSDYKISSTQEVILSKKSTSEFPKSWSAVGKIHKCTMHTVHTSNCQKEWLLRGIWFIVGFICGLMFLVILPNHLSIGYISYWGFLGLPWNLFISENS